MFWKKIPCVFVPEPNIISSRGTVCLSTAYAYLCRMLELLRRSFVACLFHCFARKFLVAQFKHLPTSSLKPTPTPFTETGLSVQPRTQHPPGSWLGDDHRPPPCAEQKERTCLGFGREFRYQIMCLPPRRAFLVLVKPQ